MVTLFVLFAAVTGVAVGLVLATLGIKNKAVKVINGIEKMSDAYAFVIGQISSGQISIKEIPQMLNNKANLVGIVSDDIEFFLEQGFNEAEILEKLYEMLLIALEDERLDFVKPLKKFEFFEGLGEEETN